jgi:hypothetical protein
LFEVHLPQLVGKGEKHDFGGVKMVVNGPGGVEILLDDELL